MATAAEQSAALAVRARLSASAPLWLDPPVLQPAGLYLELAGEDIRTRAFTLVGADGAELCLRPDMTAPAVRQALDLAEIWAGQGACVAYEGLVFRRQPQGSPLESEFRQVGAEWFAPTRDLAEREAEIVALSLSAARAAGVEPALKLGHAGLWRAAMASAGLAPAHAARLQRAFARPSGLKSAIAAAERAIDAAPLAEALAALPRAHAVETIEALYAAQGIAPIGGRTAADVADRLRGKAETARSGPIAADQAAFLRAALAIEDAPEAALGALSALADRASDPEPMRQAVAAVAALWGAVSSEVGAVEARLSPAFGRGLAYYDGFVFELEAQAFGPRASLGGGGRYDGLLRALADAEGRSGLESWGAAGFALRPARLAEAVR